MLFALQVERPDRVRSSLRCAAGLQQPSCRIAENEWKSARSPPLLPLMPESVGQVAVTGKASCGSGPVPMQRPPPRLLSCDPGAPKQVTARLLAAASLHPGRIAPGETIRHGD